MAKQKSEFEKRLGQQNPGQAIWYCLALLVATLYLTAPFELAPQSRWFWGTTVNVMSLALLFVGMWGMLKTKKNKKPKKWGLFFATFGSGIILFVSSLLIYF